MWINLKIDGFDQIEGNANEGMLSVQKNNKSLFLDIKADNVFKHNYHEVKPFNSGIGLVKYYDGWTMIDLNGKLKSHIQAIMSWFTLIKTYINIKKQKLIKNKKRW